MAMRRISFSDQTEGPGLERITPSSRQETEPQATQMKRAVTISPSVNDLSGYLQYRSAEGWIILKLQQFLWTSLSGSRKASAAGPLRASRPALTAD
jgi:hypothetical protein